MSSPYGLQITENCLICKLRHSGFFCDLPKASLQDLEKIKYARSESSSQAQTQRSTGNSSPGNGPYRTPGSLRERAAAATEPADDVDGDEARPAVTQRTSGTSRKGASSGSDATQKAQEEEKNE